MKRFLVFAILFTPLAVAVFAAPMVDRSFEPAMLVWMTGVAFPIVILPALLIAGVDWSLSSIRFHVVVTTIVGAVIALLMARYTFGQKGEYVYFALIGAVPALVCSWLSREKPRAA